MGLSDNVVLQFTVSDIEAIHLKTHERHSGSIDAFKTIDLNFWRIQVSTEL